MPVQPITSWEEHQFWLKILEDHAHFIHDYLAPDEKKWVCMAKQYIDLFARLRRKLKRIDLRSGVSSPELVMLSREAYPVALGYFQFEGYLQHLRIQNKVDLNLTPAYLNGTLDENQEYIRQLGYFVQGKEPPPLTLTDLLDLWLLDQAGHAYLLANGLDPVEGKIIEQARVFQQKFRFYLLKNRQMKGYLRFTKPIFPWQKQFVKEIAETVLAFTQLVHQVVTRYQKDQVMTRLTLRFLEHHFPEACYFLRKLEYFLPENERVPDCQFQPPYFPWERWSDSTGVSKKE